MRKGTKMTPEQIEAKKAAAAAHGKKLGNPGFSAKPGEPGYVHRDPTKAAKACAEKNAKLKAMGLGKDDCIFPDPAELAESLDGYFAHCDAINEKYSESGICLWLSKHNKKNRNVTLQTLHYWYDGVYSEHLQELVQMAYTRIMHQIETDPRYDDKAMVPYRIFLEKQKRYGGKTDKQEISNDVKFELTIKDYDEELAK